MPFYTSCPKAPWSSFLLAEMFQSHQSLATCYISSRAVGGKPHKKFIAAKFYFSRDCGLIWSLFHFSFSFVYSQAYKLNNHLSLFAHCHPVKAFSIIRFISSFSRLHCLHILGELIPLIPFIIWSTRVMSVNILINSC